MKTGVLNIPGSVRMTLSSQTPTPDFVDGGHLDMENDILVRQVDYALKTYVLSSPAPVRMTPFPPRFYLMNTKQTNDKTSHSNSIEDLDI